MIIYDTTTNTCIETRLTDEEMVVTLARLNENLADGADISVMDYFEAINAIPDWLKNITTLMKKVYYIAPAVSDMDGFFMLPVAHESVKYVIFTPDTRIGTICKEDV